MTCVTSKVFRLAAALLLPAALSSQALSPATASPCIDVALVLAVDSSASVSAGEYALQQRGIAAAFRDKDVRDALVRAGRVAVAVMFWGSENMPKPQSGWVLVEDGQGAERFARIVESMPRQVTGDTGLGAGLMASLAKFDGLNMCSLRRVVNVSGDGAETRATRGSRRAAEPQAARDLAEAMQVEINALAISNQEPELADYYAANVVTGPDAFVMEAADYGAFAEALRHKLIREISLRMLSGLPAVPLSANPVR
jgi:hypothetical protein